MSGISTMYSTLAIPCGHSGGSYSKGTNESNEFGEFAAGEWAGHKQDHWVVLHCNNATGICRHLYLLVHCVDKFGIAFLHEIHAFNC